MKIDDEDKIINFDELFVEEKPVNVVMVNRYEKPKAALLLVIYFLVTMVLAGLVQLGMLSLELGTKTINETQSMFENVEASTYSIGYLSKASYELYKADYENIEVLYETEAFVVFANKGNQFLSESYEANQITSIYEDINPKWPIKDGYHMSIKRFLGDDNSAFLEAFEIDLSDGTYYYPKEATYFTNNANAVLNFIIYVMLAASLIPITKKSLVEEFKQHFPRENITKDLGYGYLTMILVAFFANIIVTIISNGFKYLPEQALNQQAIESSFKSQYGILILAVTVVFAPVIEELIFRKSLFSLIKNPKIAIIVSSLLFGLIHVVAETSVLGFVTNWITYSASGLALGYIYIKNNHNVWSSIMVHALYNFVAVLIMIL